MYFACLEPCDVVSDQRKNAFLIGLFEAKLLETVCHWARTSHLRTAQDTAGTTCLAHSLLSHNVGGPLGHFLILLCKSCMGQI